MDHARVQKVIQTLDGLPTEVTDFEAGVLQTVLSQGYPPTPRQLGVLVAMAEHYLGEDMAAELRGQARRFP